eukprot:8380393-Alexandrium_andersonii.AAC.1
MGDRCTTATARLSRSRWRRCGRQDDPPLEAGNARSRRRRLPQHAPAQPGRGPRVWQHGEALRWGRALLENGRGALCG